MTAAGEAEEDRRRAFPEAVGAGAGGSFVLLGVLPRRGRWATSPASSCWPGSRLAVNRGSGSVRDGEAEARRGRGGERLLCASR